MWTGGKPPRIPVAATSSSSSNNNSSNSHAAQKSPTSVTAATVGRNAELEALKQRGLAKILNKHFTETTDRLAREKAAADAAVADLQARKAHTSEFHVSGDGELGPLDAMCLRANQWKRECQRKERETLLLYQRYVHKFGETGAVAVPAPTWCGSQHQWVPPAKPDTARTAAPPPRGAPRPAVAVNGTQVPELAAQIETTLEEYLRQGALSKPSVQVLGKDATFQTVAQKEEAEFRAFYRRQMEAKGVDARASEKVVAEREAYDYTHKRQFGAAANNNAGEVDPFYRNISGDWIDSAVASVEANLPCHTIYEDACAIDDDERSVVSGLTTLHSAMTREVLQDCEQSVADFLKEEQAHIRKIMEADADHSNNNIESSSFTSDAITVEAVDLANKATAEAESMVQKMEEILNEYQAKHGSANPNAKDASSAAAKGAAPNHEPRPFPTDNPDEQWMVYYDEFYQQEYYHETNSNRTQWEPPAVSVSSVSSSGGGASVLSHFEVMPERGASSSQKNAMMGGGGGSYESRVAVYRRKRRRARRRRRMAIAAAVCVVAVVAFVCWTVPPGQRSLAGLQQSLANVWTRGGAREPKEQHHKTVQKLLTEEERQQQHVLLFTEEMKRLQAEEERLKAEEEERLRREEDERQKALLHRPWGCNIPFSWLFHSRCRRLANQSPVFDLQSLVNVMLQ